MTTPAASAAAPKGIEIRLAASSGAARVLPSPASTTWAQTGHDQKIKEACTQPAAPALTPPTALTWQMVGPEGARVLGESGYVVLPPWRRKEPIVDVLTKHEGAASSPRQAVAGSAAQWHQLHRCCVCQPLRLLSRFPTCRTLLSSGPFLQWALGFTACPTQ